MVLLGVIPILITGISRTSKLKLRPDGLLAIHFLSLSVFGTLENPAHLIHQYPATCVCVCECTLLERERERDQKREPFRKRES